MNLIETLVAKASQESCELAAAFSKLNFAGIKATDSESGEPLTLNAIKQLNEILACVELLRDRGIPMAGIGDPVAVGEAKGKIVQDMEEAMKTGTLVLSEDDQNPRPEGVNEADTGLPAGGADDGQGGGDGNDEGLGDGGTGASDADGTAGDGTGDDSGAGTGDDTSGDDAGAGGDDTGGDGSGDDTSGDDTGTGGDGGTGGDSGTGDDSGSGDAEEEEEEEESGANDV